MEVELGAELVNLSQGRGRACSEGLDPVTVTTTTQLPVSNVSTNDMLSSASESDMEAELGAELDNLSQGRGRAYTTPTLLPISAVQFRHPFLSIHSTLVHVLLLNMIHYLHLFPKIIMKVKSLTN